MDPAERTFRSGYRINRFDTLGSTNDVALARGGQGDRGKLWIVAGQQTGGRGRQGRSWVSPPGNLYASLLLIDPVAPVLAPQLGFVAGVALAATIDTLLGIPGQVRLKWPNDLVHAGAKLAGILTEGVRCPNGRFACVLGFGVNRIAHPENLGYPATDLFAISPERPTLESVIATLSRRVDEALDVWDRGHGFERIREAWLAAALPRGTRLSVSTRTFQATGAFETIDDRGRLVLRTETGDNVIDAGDVFLMDRPDTDAAR